MHSECKADQRFSFTSVIDAVDMSLTVEDRAALRPATCSKCGGPLFATIVGPRCPIHGAEGTR